MNSNDHSIGDERTLRPGNPPASGDESSINSVETLKRRDAPLGTIDRYELIEELGGGGFGCVYKARDTVAGIEVAVKGMPPLVQHNREELDRVRENFALVSRLHHQFIAAPLVLHQAQNVWYASEDVRRKLRVLEGGYLFVMSFAAGVTLSQWRRQFPEGKVPVDQALAICDQIAEALDYAHGEKIVHRDVKPSNVMVETRPDGSPVCRVLDFGLAAEIRSSMSRVSQESGETSGTRPYMAPEQWQGKKQGATTDQYALAVLFYELVSGAVPFAPAFETGDPAVMSNVVTREQPEPLSELNKRQNVALLQALAKEPSARFARCGGFVAALGGEKLRKTPAFAGAATAGKRTARKGKGRWLAAAALVLAVGAGAYFAYPYYLEHQARVAAEAEAAREAAAQDAATRARITELRQSVEAALSSGNLQEAGRLLTDLESVGGTTSVSSALRQRYEGLAGERETNRRYAEASLARDQTMRIERGQTLSVKLDAMETAWREAEAARQSQSWGLALSGYDTVLARCREIGDLDRDRSAAETQRNRAEEVRRQAAGENAATDATELWTAGERTSSLAAESFDAGAFSQAAGAWSEAVAAYEQSGQHALAVQAYRKAKSEYEAALGGPTSVSAVLLESHGGDRWREVLRQSRVGEASANDPVAGAEAFGAALRGLPDAINQAQAAKRTAEINTALGQARQAKARERWQEVIAAADRVLALDANSRDAQTLKREAELNLVPTWRIVTTVAGREVPATIKIGDRTWTAPHTFTLEDGKRYTAEFSYEAGGRRYTSESASVTANWKGEQERRVTLQEIRGPVAGQNWTSPATGMEFVWIPAMNLWVGKFEVTNGEYRRMHPNHNSGEYSGHSLNGDRQPVVRVNFDDAKAYAEWLTEQDRSVLGGSRYRLPSEQEWMTYAQCGDGREYPWGNEWPPPSGRAGNYSDLTARRVWGFTTGIDGYDDGSAVTAPVERLWRNPWGLHGVGGNVWEACASDSTGGSFGAWRGASWYRNCQDALRCSNRFDFDGSFRFIDFGFRLVLSR